MNSTKPPAWLTTSDFSAAICQRPQTLRKHLCLTGTYYGIQPAKMPNGRLLWPATAIDALTGGAAK